MCEYMVRICNVELGIGTLWETEVTISMAELIWSQCSQITAQAEERFKVNAALRVSLQITDEMAD